mmetsp:Transcript_19400/g.51810  ORF Transcript_19400/g.51810 Transcript_19400/m.51810 type:complete len:210 (-) Transcript_19400:81-710(-)
MVAHSSFDDFSYMFKGGAVLLLAVVAERHIIRQVRLVAQRIHRIAKHLHRLSMALLLPEQSPLEDLPLFGFGAALVQDAAGQLHLILLVRDGSLQQHHALCVLRILDRRTHLRGFLIHSRLHEGLHMVDFVFIDIWTSLCQLPVDIRSIREVLHVVVAVAQKRQRTAACGEVVQLIAEDLNGLVVLLLLNMLIDRLCKFTLTNLRAIHN